MRKTEFARTIGITYRALANYLNGARNPRDEILKRMAQYLEVTPSFLSDDTQELELTIEERFIRRTCVGMGDLDKAAAAQFLAQSRGLFAGNAFSEDDKEALLKCLIEIYEDSKKDGE